MRTLNLILKFLPRKIFLEIGYFWAFVYNHPMNVKENPIISKQYQIWPE
jgi:hypothetical protein